MLLLVTPTHCYIARVKPTSGSLLLLYSIPQPHPSQLQTAAAGGGATAAPVVHVPAAAWLPHHRKQGAATQVHGEMVMPVGVLAIAWGPRLVLFNVPLIGDQAGPGDAGEGGRCGDGGGGERWTSGAGCRLLMGE